MLSPPQYIVIAAVALVGAISTLWFIHRRRRRTENPQDYAYYLHSRFGSTLRLAPAERIRRGLPGIPQATVEEWLREFDKVSALIDTLSQQGGSAALSGAEVERRLRTEFPFLKSEGLRQASFLVDYIAWHDGYLPKNAEPGEL